MAKLEFEVELDTSRLKGFREFLEASTELARFLDSVPSPRFAPAVERWRVAVRGVSGTLGVTATEKG